MIRAILLDIEGTTSPVEFVYNTLFPYARARLRTFLADHVGDADVLAILIALRAEYESDEARTRDRSASAQADPNRYQTRFQGPLPEWSWSAGESAELGLDIESAASYLEWLMEQDRKSTALKAIQGLIWKRGFENAELKAQLFPDVAPAFERWKAAGITVAIFSSGSVLAQKQLFAHTNQGDLTGYLSAYFDTETGPKRDPASYEFIATTLGRACKEVLFISDVPEELIAARKSGMEVVLALRPGNSPVDPKYWQRPAAGESKDEAPTFDTLADFNSH